MNRNQKTIDTLVEMAEIALALKDYDLCRAATITAMIAKADGETSDGEYTEFVRKTQELVKKLLPDFKI